MDRKALARRIHAASHLTGTFTLRSGAVSHEYFDKYRFESDPELLRDIAEAASALVMSHGSKDHLPNNPLVFDADATSSFHTLGVNFYTRSSR